MASTQAKNAAFMEEANTKEYVVRVEGTAGHYGLGEVVSPNVALFRKGFYNLTKEELDRKLAQVRKA